MYKIHHAMFSSRATFSDPTVTSHLTLSLPPPLAAAPDLKFTGLNRNFPVDPAV
jgi:hypothetical protein